MAKNIFLFVYISCIFFLTLNIYASTPRDTDENYPSNRISIFDAQNKDDSLKNPLRLKSVLRVKRVRSLILTLPILGMHYSTINRLINRNQKYQDKRPDPAPLSFLYYDTVSLVGQGRIYFKY